MAIRDFLIGKPLRSDAEPHERVGPARGIPLLGLDALASASYGPEAALTILLVAGAAGSRWIVPVSLCLIGLLLIVYLSYRQTIGAYPNGGGSFTVAHENLGDLAGLVAAAATHDALARRHWRSDADTGEGTGRVDVRAHASAWFPLEFTLQRG